MEVFAIQQGDIAFLDAGDVFLEDAPQGGFVLYVGVRAKNTTCEVLLRGSFIDPTNGFEYAFDGRPSLLKIGLDGWGMPEPKDYSALVNLVPCPDYHDKDVVGSPFLLNLEAQTGSQTINTSILIVPRCPPSEDYCNRECSSLYDAGLHD